MSAHVVSNTGVMLGRSIRHVTRSMDTIITVTIMPIAFMLLFRFVFGGAIQTGTDNYTNYLMPGILLIAIASGISYTGFRLFNDMQSGIVAGMGIADMDFKCAPAITEALVKRVQHENWGYLDMQSPGVEVRPLVQMTGEAEFTEVFFDHVRVPKTHMLGQLNDGWNVAITTLMYERLTLGFGLQMRLRIALDGLLELAKGMEKSGRVVTKEPVMRQKLALLWIDTECLKYTGARAITKLLRGEMPGPEASTGKMAWVDTHQRLQEIAMEIEGPYSQLVKGSDWAVEGGVWPHSFLRSRANSSSCHGQAKWCT